MGGPVCYQCAKRRCERKEIITEIVDTEIKYGRDLRIVQDEFQRPMAVAGLLTPDQLQGVFLNVEELAEKNRRFTQHLKSAIEVALDTGDDDLVGVHVGKMFLRAEEDMMAAFKSYCTRQVRSLKKYKTMGTEIYVTAFTGISIRPTGRHGEGTRAAQNLPEGVSNGEHDIEKNEPQLFPHGNPFNFA